MTTINFNKSFFSSRRNLRLLLLILVIVPFIYWRQFYEHFYAYLTGTIINEVITRQWRLVIFFIVMFGLFIIPLNFRRRAKWLDYGLIGAFFVSLFIEMYGLPLTVLFASKYFFTPGAILPANVLEFNFLGVGIGMDLSMVYGAVLMTLGMILIVYGWYSLYTQTKQAGLAKQGLYGISRHPQYLGFILIIIGWFFG